MAESIILDPAELWPTRGELDITAYINAESGIDWGQAAMAGYMAEASVGAIPVDYRIENRQITIPLTLKAIGATSFDTIRNQVQKKVGQWQSGGGAIKRVTTTGGTVYADVVTAGLALGGDWYQARTTAQVDMHAEINAELLPDFYEPEITLSDHVETTATEIRFTEGTVFGDFPLGNRCRLVVDEDEAVKQRALFWSFRARKYSTAASATSVYEAEALQPLDQAVKAAKTGASGGTVVTHGTVGVDFTPVLGTDIGGATWMTHTGSNRIWARAYSSAGTAVQMRLLWDLGDFAYPIYNDPVRLYDAGTFNMIDLGEIRAEAPPTGNSFWRGQIHAAGNAGTEALSIDRIWVANTDDGYGVLRAPFNTQSAGSFTARSEFNLETAGSITGQPLNVGGSWLGAGDSDDLFAGFGVASRGQASDANINLGRYITASASSLTDSVTQVQLSTNRALDATFRCGLVSRYAGTGDWVFFGAEDFVKVIKRSASGTATTIASIGGGPGGSGDPWGGWVLNNGALYPNVPYVFRLVIDSTGFWVAYIGIGTSFLTQVLAGFDPAFATGGALAGGRSGIVDTQTSAVSTTRTYDNFRVWTPVADAVAFASQSAELSTEALMREDATGQAYSPITYPTGDLPRLPNQASAGTVEVMVKMSRGDMQTYGDPSIDNLSARLSYNPCWLTVPD